MKQTVTFCGFCDAFRDYDRNENFSYKGKRALFDWIEDLDEDCGTETELDVIALCCEFTEYEDLEEIQGNYTDIETIDQLRDNTLVIEFDGGIIIQNY